MSGSASTVWTVPLTLRENFWAMRGVLHSRSDNSCEAGHIPVHPTSLLAPARILFPNLPHGNTTGRVELALALQRFVMGQRLHCGKQVRDLALRDSPRDEHDA